MSIAKIKKTAFYDQYGCKKVALLEEGQTVRVEGDTKKGDRYLCSVINPSDVCKYYGGYDQLLVKVHPDDLETEQPSELFIAGQEMARNGDEFPIDGTNELKLGWLDYTQTTERHERLLAKALNE